jgi:hypothetical protein
MSRFRLGSILALAGILITTGGCAESPSAPVEVGAGLELLALPQGPSFAVSAGGYASKVIGPEGGIIALGDSRLTFPAGAVSQPTEISVRADGRFQGVRLSPHGLQFPANAQPVLELRAKGSAAARGDLQVVYVDEVNQILEVLPTTRHGNTVSVNLEHFSGYLLSGGRAEEMSTP